MHKKVEKSLIRMIEYSDINCNFFSNEYFKYLRKKYVFLIVIYTIYSKLIRIMTEEENLCKQIFEYLS